MSLRSAVVIEPAVLGKVEREGKVGHARTNHTQVLLLRHRYTPLSYSSGGRQSAVTKQLMSQL